MADNPDFNGKCEASGKICMNWNYLKKGPQNYCPVCKQRCQAVTLHGQLNVDTSIVDEGSAPSQPNEPLSESDWNNLLTGDLPQLKGIDKEPVMLTESDPVMLTESDLEAAEEGKPILGLHCPHDSLDTIPWQHTAADTDDLLRWGENNTAENTVSRVVPRKINSIFIDFSGYQMKQVGGMNHNNLPSRNDSSQFAKSGEDGSGIKANENSVEHSSGKKENGRNDLLAGFSLSTGSRRKRQLRGRKWKIRLLTDIYQTAKPVGEADTVAGAVTLDLVVKEKVVPEEPSNDMQTLQSTTAFQGVNVVEDLEAEEEGTGP